MTSTVSYVDLDGNTRSCPAAEIHAFRAGLRGESFEPGDDGYDGARQIWNGMIDVRPVLIAKPTGVADVVHCVKFAREHDMLTAVRGGGHNVAGNAVVEGGLVIDLSGMRHVQVDASARRAWVAGGCQLGDVDRETQLHGLAAPLGVVSETGVAGLTLSGGAGWLRSRFGMACDAVRTFEVVTADGRVVRATAEEHPDLYWALRGGGGNFGVVTAFEFELYPVGPEVVLVGIAYPIDRMAEIMPIWRNFMDQAPPELSTNLMGWTLPDSESFPVEARGVDICLIGGCWSGPVDEGLALLQPLRELGPLVIDLTGPMSYCEVQTAFDPFFKSGERRNYWKSIYIDRMDEEFIELVAAKALDRPDPWVLLAVFDFAGRATEEPSAGTAFAGRDSRWLLSIDAGWVKAEKDEACIGWARRFRKELERFSETGGCYLNFPGLGEEGDALMRATFGEERYRRLREVKAAWDPTNLFRMNQNIGPA